MAKVEEQKVLRPYEIDHEDGESSRKISDPVEVLKYKINGLVMDELSEAGDDEILKVLDVTRLELSQMKVMFLDELSIEKMIRFAMKLNLEIEVKKKF